MAPTKDPADAPDVHNPRRILAVALAESQEHLARVIKDLTGEHPTASAGTGALAGTTQELALVTAYYRAQVPIWLDLVGSPGDGGEEGDNAEADDKTTGGKVKKGGEDNETAGDEDPTSPRQWADAFLADEAKEVRDALGGVVAVVEVHPGSAPRQKELVEHVGRLVQGLGAVYDFGEEGDKDDDEGEEDAQDFREPWDGISVVVGVSPTPLDEDTMAAWDDACNAAGLEFVAVAPGQDATNEFGEKTGIPRLLEALEANDWDMVGGGAGDDDDDDDALFGSFENVKMPGSREGDEIDFDDPESADFGFDRDDFAGLRQAIWQQSTAEHGDADADDEDDDDGRDQAAIMESMMRKLQAARLQSELLPPAQRRAMAARVVNQVMKQI